MTGLSRVPARPREVGCGTTERLCEPDGLCVQCRSEKACYRFDSRLFNALAVNILRDS